MGRLGKVWARGEDGKDKTCACTLGWAAGEKTVLLALHAGGSRLDHSTSVFRMPITFAAARYLRHGLAWLAKLWRELLAGFCRVHGA
jgi:hypothetical protein